MAFGQGQTRFAIAGCQRPKTFAFQIESDQCGRVGVVFNNKDGFFI